jgi:phosphonate transport system substrate-binding protein
MLTVVPLLGALLAASPEPRVLRVTAISEAKDAFEKNGAIFAAWLEKEVGVPVEVKVASTYEAAVKAFETGDADLGWLGGVTLVQTMVGTNGRVRPIVIREKDREFRSYVIASASLGANSLEALRGKRFTFGARSSTSGHVMPRFFLQSQGIVPEKFFSSVSYSGDHKKTAHQVATGEQDCGALNFQIFDEMVKDKSLDPTKVKVIWTSPPFQDHAWAANRDVDSRLGKGTLDRITQAFLKLDQSRKEDRAVLDILKTDKYIAAQAEWWRGISSALEVIKPEAIR